MNTEDTIRKLHKTHTVGEIADICNDEYNRVRLIAKKIKIICIKHVGIKQYHDQIMKLAMTNTKTEIADILGIKSNSFHSYCAKNNIVCKKWDPKSAKSSSHNTAMASPTTAQELTLNIIRRAGYSPVYAENRPTGRGLYFTGRIVIDNLILPNYKAAQKFAAAL